MCWHSAFMLTDLPIQMSVVWTQRSGVPQLLLLLYTVLEEFMLLGNG